MDYNDDCSNNCNYNEVYIKWDMETLKILDIASNILNVTIFFYIIINTTFACLNQNQLILTASGMITSIIIQIIKEINKR